MKKYSCIMFFILVTLFIFGCDTRNELLPLEYLKFIKNNENAFTSSVGNGKYIFEVIYRPSDMYVAEKLSSGYANLDSLLKQYDGLVYFIINVKSENIDSVNVKTKEYLQFGLEHDISLQINQESILPSIYQFENIGLESNINRIFLAFETKKIFESKEKFIINIKENYFINTTLPILIDFQKLPKLKNN